MGTTACYAAMAGFLCASVIPAGAETVRLQSRDGTIRINGELISYDGERYVVETIVGEIEIAAIQVSCEGLGCPDIETTSGEFAISGSSNIVNDLMPALIADYSQGINLTTTPTFEGDGSQTVALSNRLSEVIAKVMLTPNDPDTAIRDLQNSRSDLAISDRAATPAEVSAFATANLGVLNSQEQELLLGLDGLIAVTSSENPVDAISEAQIADILSGRIVNWSQLGGPDQSINVFAPNPQTRAGRGLNELVLTRNQISLAPGVTVLEENSDVAEAVLTDPAAFGIANYSGRGEAKVMDLRGVCGILTPADPFTIKTEEYPLSQRIIMYRANSDASARVDNFTQYVASEYGQQVVSRFGLVNQAVSSISSQVQGLRYANAMWPTDAQTNLAELGAMVRELLPAERVSLTFRFALGSTELDTRAQQDIGKLANLLADGETFANKELLLVGFTDSVGDANGNRGLSRVRADQVRAAIEAVAIPGSLDTTPIRTFGFGEASPLNCNEAESGRQINRRVEVWVREIVR